MTETPDPEHGERFKRVDGVGHGRSDAGHPGRDRDPAARHRRRHRDADAAPQLEARVRRDVGVPGRPGRGGRRRRAPTTRSPTARRAAVREAEEECGLVVGVDDLVAVSHWTPPPVTPEAVLHLVLRRARARGRGDDRRRRDPRAHVGVARRTRSRSATRRVIELAPPTWVTLHNLGEADRHRRRARPRRARSSRWCSSPRSRRPPTGSPRCGTATTRTRPARTPTRPGPRHRLVMTETAWRYERTDA